METVRELKKRECVKCCWYIVSIYAAACGSQQEELQKFR